MIRGITASGFKYEIDEKTFDDMEMLDMIDHMGLRCSRRTVLRRLPGTVRRTYSAASDDRRFRT